MKKVISLLLVFIMVLPFASVTAFAAEETWANTETISTDKTIADGDTVIVTGTITLAKTLTIRQNGQLIIRGGSVTVAGRIANYGKITVENGGSLYVSKTNEGTQIADSALYNEGTISISSNSDVTIANGAHAYNKGVISNAEYMTVKGTLKHYVSIPADFQDTYSYTETWNRTNMTVNFDVKYFMYHENSKDLDYLDAAQYTDGTEVWVDHGNELFILIIPQEGVGDWVDTGRMQLVVNGQITNSKARIANTRGVFSIKPTSAIDITVYSTKYTDIVRLFEIELPRTKAYYVETFEGNVDSVTVEYGKTLTFHVVLSPDYDKSNYKVYVNTLYIEPGEWEYYDITGPIDINGMASAGGVQEDITITVMGVAPNERIEMMGSIVTFIQDIVGVIKSIFEYFLDIFGLGSFDDLGGALGQG